MSSQMDFVLSEGFLSLLLNASMMLRHSFPTSDAEMAADEDCAVTEIGVSLISSVMCG